MKRKRRQDPKQTAFDFRPTGHGGARPGAGRPRVRASRVPHRAREDFPGPCPALVTLRVGDGVPALRRACFLRAFRESLRQAAERPGFRVVHYSVQDNHAHFVVEADDKRTLANGMKSLGARFARCVNRVFGRSGKVLATRFHHVLKRTPTEMRRALAYVLLNVRKHYSEIPSGGAGSRRWCWTGRVPGSGSTGGRAGRRRRSGATPTATANARWRRPGRGCCRPVGGGSG